jgi:AraC-like DNA-binding protein
LSGLVDEFSCGKPNLIFLLTYVVFMRKPFWLEAVENFVISNVNDSSLSVNLLIKDPNVSKSTLLRQLSKLTGLIPNKYINEHRLNHARDLLENRRYNTIAQVAYKAGFKDANSFARSFKQRFGTTPSEVMEG